MQDKMSERRLTENEVVFRSMNEKVQKGIDELEKMAEETNQEELLLNNDMPLLFYCECSDENCLKRIPVRPSEYKDIHQNRSCFIIVHGHEVKSIERVVRREAEYCVVEKFDKPPESVDKLNKTDLHNV